MNKILILLVFVVITASLNGCNTTSSSESKIKSVSITPINSLFIEEKEQIEKNYKVGDVLTSFVGESVIKRKSFVAKVQSRLSATPAANAIISGSDIGQVTLQKGRNFQVQYDVFINGVRYTAMNVPSKAGVIGVLFDGNGVLFDRVVKDGKLLPEVFQISPINSYVQMKRPEEVLSRKITENFEIIFGGVNNNQITMTYREYSPDDVARTAFFQELTYPTNSEFLRYKSLKLKVIKTTSEGLTFEVVSD